MALWEKKALSPSLKKVIRSVQYSRSQRNFTFFQPLDTIQINLMPQRKKYLCGGVYIMENKDASTGY